MMNHKLALKALNQYRRRDILPYLGLRYYLANSVGKKNRWIDEVCIRLATVSNDSNYFKTYHFKDFADGVYKHRDMYLPAPNEALAEVALLTEIVKYKSFKPQACVYSYILTDNNDTGGVFKPYFTGFKNRHCSIADACKSNADGFVLYTDIKKFYPSIKASDAFSAWERACSCSTLDSRYVKLGENILKKQKVASKTDDTGNGILTGPLFSHVIANLLLDPIDTKMTKLSNGRYWRYVDDVIFVGTKEEILYWRNELDIEFKKLGLHLHDGEKDFEISCAEWLNSEHDFDNDNGRDWAILIGDIKKFLLSNPSKVDELRSGFIHNDIRIPVIDYSSLVVENKYLKSMQEFIYKYKWARSTFKRISIEQLIFQAKNCQKLYKVWIDRLLDKGDGDSEFETKRLTPKLRFLSTRLLYLLPKHDLGSLSHRLEQKKDLYFLAKIMEAVATDDVSHVLQMGPNAAHATAQLIRVHQETATAKNIGELTSIVEQSLAIFEFNGVKVNSKINGIDSELSKFARADNISKLMMSTDGFVKELACLHGINPSQHKKILDTSFDRNEDLALDIINLINKSKYH